MLWAWVTAPIRPYIPTWLPGLQVSIPPDAPLYGLLAIGIIAAWLGRKRSSNQTSKETENEVGFGPRHTPWPLRVLDHLFILLGWRNPHDLHTIGSEKVDRRHAAHFVYGGPTGSGKTNAVAATRINGKRPQVINTFDFSGPLLGAVQALEKRYPGKTIVWTPQGEVGLDLFLGTYREIARRWTGAFEDNGIGQYKRAMRRRMGRAIQEIDNEGSDRNLRNFIRHLDPNWRKEHCNTCLLSLYGHPLGEHPAVAFDDATGALEKAAVESWLLRLEDLEADLAPTALGHELDLAKALRAGKTVFFHVDAAVQTGTMSALAGIFVQENIRCIRKVRGGFRVIIEEAGAIVRDLDAFRLLMQAGRVRGVYVDVILQSIGQLPEFFRQNIRGWVLFSQEEDKERRMAATRTGLKPVDFDSRVLKKYYAWVKVNDLCFKYKFGRAPEAKYEIDWDDEVDPLDAYEAEDEDDWDTPVDVPPEPQPVAPVVTPIPPQPPTMPVGPPLPLTPVPVAYGPGPRLPPPVYTHSALQRPKDGRQLLNIWAHHRFPAKPLPDGTYCHESTYRLNSGADGGRPGCSFQGDDWTTYVLVRTLQDAYERHYTVEKTQEYLDMVRTRDAKAGGWGVHHRCYNKLCDNPEHLTWLTGADNTADRWLTMRAEAAT